MKKHMQALQKMKQDELVKKAAELRTEIADVRRGIKMGDVQNTQVAKQRRRELARIHTLLKNPVTEAKAPVAEVKKKAVAKTAAKEKK